MKYFLSCPHCAFPNDATSEFLTFCEECKKKLPNNFREWKKSHPDLELRDFHLQACITNPVFTPLSQKDESRPKARRKVWPLVMATVALLSLAFLFLFPSIYRNSQLILYLKTTLLADASFNWHRQTYGDYGLSLESPVELEEIPNPGSLPQGAIRKIQIYQSDLSGPLSLVALSTEFSPEIGTVNLQASISGFINQIRSMPGITNFSVSQKETSLSGCDGFEQSGSYLHDGQPKSFLSVGVTKGYVLWQIMVVCDRNQEMEDAARRIIDSLEILYNTGV